MQPQEPPAQGTSLDLTSDAGTGTPVAQPGTDLVLPPSAPPPQPVAHPDAQPDAQPEPARPSGPLGNLVVAHFRRVEIAMLARVLVGTLAGALPPSMVEVERRRSFGVRHGDPIGVTVTAGERRLSFRAPEVGVVEATVGHVVRGVVLSSTPVPLAQWLDALGEMLDEIGRADEAARVALERAVLA